MASTRHPSPEEKGTRSFLEMPLIYWKIATGLNPWQF